MPHLPLRLMGFVHVGVEVWYNPNPPLPPLLPPPPTPTPYPPPTPPPTPPLHPPVEVWYNEDFSAHVVCIGSGGGDPPLGEDPHCANSNAFSLSLTDHNEYFNIRANFCAADRPAASPPSPPASPRSASPPTPPFTPPTLPPPHGPGVAPHAVTVLLVQDPVRDSAGDLAGQRPPSSELRLPSHEAFVDVGTHRTLPMPVPVVAPGAAAYTGFAAIALGVVLGVVSAFARIASRRWSTRRESEMESEKESDREYAHAIGLTMSPLLNSE